MNFVFTRKTTLFFLLIFCSLYTLAQDYTYSFSDDRSEIFCKINLDKNQLAFEDSIAKEIGAPTRIAEIIPIDIDINTAGKWIELPNSQKIWKLTIEAPDAYGLIVSYKDFYIPKGGELLVYNEDYSHSMTSYTNDQNPPHGIYSTETLVGDKVTLEYIAPSKSKESPRFHIDGVGYKYRELNENFYVPGYNKQRILNSSANCMINVNCPEGKYWQNQKKGVVQMRVKIGGQYYSCSGSLVNNTNEDGTPYILSAYHCFDNGFGSTATFAATEFRFNYEFPGCENELIDPDPYNKYRIIGCDPLVLNPTDGGSDGALVKLAQSIPSTWDVYYNGWDLRDQDGLFTSGVVIHHPNGDVKKITTYANPLTSTTWHESGIDGIPNAHWEVKYTSSVTQGGSSGSPLFNPEGLIVGTLTGGSSYCQYPNNPDLYGKMAYHWDKHSNSNLWMKTYLDPNNKLEIQGQSGQQLRGVSASDISVVEPENKSRFSVYFDEDGSMKIESKKDFMTSVRVFDLLGNFISSGSVNNISIKSIPALSWVPGVYVVKVSFANGGSEVKKILKAK